MMPDEPSDMVGRTFGDRYRVISTVGRGPVSEVVVAVDDHTGDSVGLKIFDQAVGEDPDFADRVIAAVSRSAGLEHPNIARVLDWGLDGVRLWIASELCAGGSLRSLLDRGERLTPSQTLVMCLELARGLAHAHAHGLEHRGLRPENVLFTAEQRLRISDFGLSEVLADAPLPPDRALDMVRYLSPEQAAGRPVGPATDLYALALVAHEAMTGHAPTVADTAVGTMMLRADSPADPADDAGGLRGPLERAGRLDPNERPEADELTIGLLAAAESMSRPGPLPLAGVPGLAGVATDGPADTVADHSHADGHVASSVTEPNTEGDDAADQARLTVVGDEQVGAEAPVALEDLTRAEPAFATSEIEDPVLDVPSTSTARAGVFRPDADDLDDSLPRWPLAVLALLVAGVVAAIVLVSGLATGGDEAVPDLVGLDETALDDLAVTWPIERLETRRNGTVAGMIVDQTPAPGIRLPSDEPITVTVSLGAEMVEIPADLGGVTLDQAQTRLGVEGLLVGLVTEEHSETVEPGLVIGLDEPTRQKPQGDTVALRVSIGPEDRMVPDTLVGTTIADATAALAALRLQAVEEQVYDPVAEPGTVLGIVPSPGQTVAADSPVTLLVSAGPEPVEMPDLAGLSLAEAVDAIEALGLIFADTEGTPGEPVLGTIPPARAVVDVGAEVTIVLADPPEEDDGEAADDQADG